MANGLFIEKFNMAFTDIIATLTTLYLIENFKLCNKYQSFLAKHLGLVTKKVSKKDLTSQMDAI